MTIRPDILTITGEYFDFLNPKQSKGDILWIAHALSNVCRFGGHTKFHYSVAQHSVLVSKLVPAEFALEGLLHDITEAVLGDVPTPLKQFLHDYKAIEASLEHTMRQWYSLPVDMSPEVKHADLEALGIEKYYLLPPTDDAWAILSGINCRFRQFEVKQMSQQQAKDEFLKRFLEIVKP